MFKNYLKVAWRNLSRQKTPGLINAVGLSLGLCSCILITIFLAHELSYDRWHKNSKRIFDLSISLMIANNNVQFPNTSYITAPLLKQSVPGIESFMRLYQPKTEVDIESPLSPGVVFGETGMTFADTNFFDFFSFRLLHGDKGSVLSRPFSVALSQTAAKKYFGIGDPRGKTLKIRVDSTFLLYQVTGVFEDVPSNSTIRFDILSSNSSLAHMTATSSMFQDQTIQPGDFKTYLLMRKAGDTGATRSEIRNLSTRNPDTPPLESRLTALPDVHLNSGKVDNSLAKYLRTIPFVAGLILLLALINYMSLATARATLRAKEIGVRKVIGAKRLHIVIQFYLESALYSVPAFLLAYGLCYFLVPWFFGRIGIEISTTFLSSPYVILSILALLVITVLVAGSYPSLVLSSFNAASTIKGNMSAQRGGAFVRKFFTVLQFTISVALITCGLVIGRQLYFIRHTDTGLDRESVVMVKVPKGFGNRYESFKHDITILSGIHGTATARYAMYRGYDMLLVKGAADKDNLSLPLLTVDNDFISLLGINWKYAPPPGTSLTAPGRLVLNETAAEKLGLNSGEPIGKRIDNSQSGYDLAGIVRDFNINSLEYKVKPLALAISADSTAHWGDNGCCLFAKIEPHVNISSVIGSMDKVYRRYDTEAPFSFVFLDDAFNEQYKAEDRLAWIITTFSRITLALAVLGLFGLAAFSMEQRKKEVGIRKVLGAGNTRIAVLLSAGFLRLVLISVIMAAPLAWVFMQRWLDNFAYKIPMNWWMFAAPGLLAMLVATLTIGYHTLRAAARNPVSSIRSE